jgi:hypothetical protein
MTRAQTDNRKRRLTLQNLIASGDEIWVKNNSGPLTGKEAGNIVMQVGTGNVIDTVVIPPGSDPVCLTDQVTPKLLGECMDLFKLVKSEALLLLDPADANTYYEQNQERKRIVDEKIDKILNSKREDTPITKPVGSGNVVINPKVGDICLKAKHAAISEREALERLMEQAEVLSADDYSYLMSNGVFTTVKNWARDQAKSVAEADMDPVEVASKK